MADVRLEIEMSDNEEYSADSIVVLEGMEAVRRRPSMYIGSTGPKGLAHLVWEVISNSIDEHLAGHATRVDVRRAHDGSWWVRDDGRGVPVDTHPEVLEKVFCTLHSGSTWDGHAPHIHGGLFGLGVAPVCALSSWMRVEIRRAGVIWQQLFVHGRPAGPLARVGSCQDTGTAVQYLPDLEIFMGERPKPADLRPRMIELAALTPKMAFTLQGEDLSTPGGILALASTRAGPGATLQIAGDVHDIDVQVAVAWGLKGQSNRLFVNHVAMVETAPVPNELLGSTRQEGRHAVASLVMRDPRFAGPTRARLDNPEALMALQHLLSDALPGFLADHPEVATPVV